MLTSAFHRGKRTFRPESATKRPRLDSGITEANSIAAFRLYDFESMAKLADHNGRPDWAGALRTGSMARV